MNWQSVFNPFSKFSEKQLLLVGLFFFVISGFISFYTRTQMDSVFHFSDNENLTINSAFLYVGISCVSAILFLFLLAVAFNKKTRIIDIINTVLISQAPNFILLLLTKFSGMNEIAKRISASAKVQDFDFNTLDLVKLLFTSLFILAIAIYGMVLIFNGFKTATNFKKPLHITLFIVLLLFFILFHQIYMQRVNL
jgi:hypothetical protein